MAVVLILDALIVLIACGSAYLWYLASRNLLRRVSRHEAFDAADMNRVIVAINRMQVLSARAALAMAAASVLATIRFAMDALAA